MAIVFRLILDVSLSVDCGHVSALFIDMDGEALFEGCEFS